MPVRRPLGVVYFNAFVIKAQEPILIDTHTALDREKYIDAVRSLIDPQDVKWIFVTHDDRDHVGNLQQAMSICPNATLVTSWLSLARICEEWIVPIERVRLLNPGGTFDAGGRSFVAIRPPLFDSPGTSALFDARTRTLFAADCFGAVAPHAANEVGDIDEEQYARAFYTFNAANSAWVSLVDRQRYGQTIEAVRRLGPELILSAHGPAARGRTDLMLNLLAAVPEQPPYPPLEQDALTAMLAAERHPFFL